MLSAQTMNWWIFQMDVNAGYLMTMMDYILDMIIGLVQLKENLILRMFKIYLNSL